MKREIKLLFSFFAGIVLSASLASAYYFPNFRFTTQNLVDSLVRIFEPILRALFGGNTWTGYYLFEKLLLFLVLVSFIYVILGRVPMFSEQKGVRWIVTIVVPLIGIRFISFDWLNSIFLQYGALSIFLTSILPFIIIFFFLHNLSRDYPILRKLGWVFFIGVYVGLWSNTNSETQSTVYFWTTLVAILALVLDRRIELYLTAKEFAKSSKYSMNSRIADLSDQIDKLERQIATGAYPGGLREGKSHLKELMLTRKYLMKHRMEK